MATCSTIIYRITKEITKYCSPNIAWPPGFLYSAFSDDLMLKYMNIWLRDGGGCVCVCVVYVVISKDFQTSYHIYTCQGTVWRSWLHVWLVMWRSWVRTPSKAPVVSLSKKPLWLSTGWFQERIRAWYHNRTKNKLRALWKIDLNVKYTD